MARFVGYELIPTSTFERTPLGTERDVLKGNALDDLLRRTLLALGASECVSVPLVSKADAALFAASPVEIMNPLNLEKDRLRSSVAINLLDAASRNERFGASGGRLFEIGRASCRERV